MTESLKDFLIRNREYGRWEDGYAGTIENAPMTEADFSRVLKQHAKDIRCANGGGDGSEPGWYAADVLDYVADNLREIAARQP